MAESGQAPEDRKAESRDKYLSDREEDRTRQDEEEEKFCFVIWFVGVNPGRGHATIYVSSPMGSWLL